MTAYLDPTGIVSHDGWFHNGQAWKTPCRVATTANIAISTALNAGDTIDGVTLAAGDRVLVKDQTTGSQNGIWVAGATPVRAYDMDQDQTTDVKSEEIGGAFVYVVSGTANGGKVFHTTNALGGTIGTTAIVWTELTTASPLTIKDEGTPLATAATSIDFVGAGVTASGTGAAKTVTIPGGASTLDDLTDVTITSPANHDQLAYDGTVWRNSAAHWKYVLDAATGTVLIDAGTGAGIEAWE
jgi:hypothetical protein